MGLPSFLRGAENRKFDNKFAHQNDVAEVLPLVLYLAFFSFFNFFVESENSFWSLSDRNTALL